MHYQNIMELTGQLQIIHSEIKCILKIYKLLLNYNTIPKIKVQNIISVYKS